MAMELNPGGNGKSVLAIAMLAAIGTPDALQPGAFARITSWSHGHASVDTGKCSEWGNTDDPVFLPISVQDGLDAAMELEVSLWEEVTGESGDISRMFDAVAEVSLPPPKDLGASERHSIERTFPLEENGVQAGTLTLRAWIVTPGLEEAQRSSSAGYLNDASVPPRRVVSDNRWRSDDEDERLYELSESSDKTSVPTRVVSGTPHSQGSKSSRQLTSEASAALSVHGQGEGVLSHAREPLRSGSRSTRGVRESRKSGDRPLSAGYYTQSRRTSSQQAAVENAANSLENAANQLLPPSRVYAPDNVVTTGARAAVKTTPPGFPDRGISPFGHESAGGPPRPGFNAADTEMADRGIDPPLDVAASLLALTPSYPPGQAEVRVWVHGALVGRDLISETPPYVRVSFPSKPSGVDSIARTGPLHGPISTHAAFQANGRTREGESLTTPTANAVEYLPKEEDAGRHVSLSLGSADMPLVSEGGLPPVLRLEIVWGRSLGRCGLSLTEALRRPGSTFKQMKAPIWREERKGQPNCRNRGSTDGGAAGNGARQNEAVFDGTRRFSTGQVHFDVGVRLTENAESSPPEVNTSTEATVSFVRVEAIGVRVAGARGGGPDSGMEQFDRIIGVSAELALGDETRLATIDPRHLDVSEKVGGPTSAAHLDPQHRSAVLTSRCTETDILVLRLERRPRTPQIGESASISRDPRNREDGEGRTGHALSMPVSDINGCFCHRAQWVAVDGFREDSPSKKAGNQNNSSGQDGSGGHHLEIQLRVTVTQASPTNQLALGGTASEESRPAAGSVPRPGTCCFTGSSFDKNSAFGAINSDASWSAFEAWVLSRRNGCGQSHAILSSTGSGESPPRAGRTLKTVNGVRGSASAGPGQGPGVLRLEVLAMIGQALDLAETETGEGRRLSEPQRWWVRVTVSDGGGGSVTVDSPLGEDGEGVWQDGQNAAGSRAKCSIVVRWPAGNRARAECAVHWTPRKRVLPTASLAIFRGKMLTAESTLELPPIIMSSGRVLTFLHPCIPTPAGDGSPFQRSEFFLELRGVFAGSSSGHGSDESYGSFSPRLAPGPRIARPAQSGGILCIQVLAVRRLHRAVRSAVALPFLVVFSLPPDKGSCCTATSIPLPADENGRRGQQGVRTACGKRGDVASLKIEPCRLGSVTVLASLFGGYVSNTTGADLPCGQDNATEQLRLLGSTWLAISDDVMKRGHLHDGIGGSSAGAKACEMRLGVHFMPDFPSAAGTAEQLPGQESDDANYVSIILEEGREISHPEMPVGPLDLFAEVCVHYQPRGGERRSQTGGEPTRTVPVGASQQSERVVGPLPLREAPSNAPASGVGSSPCWQHLLRVPLPPALLRILRSASPANRTGGSASATAATAVLAVEIKSASRRVVDRRSPPGACNSCDIVPGSVAIQGEQVVERCLLIGVARLRLPLYTLQREHGRECSPLSGWYVVKEENSGAHRGKVKLSVLPPNWSARVRTFDEQDSNDNNSNNRRGVSCSDQRGTHRHGSVAPATSARAKLQRASAAGCSNVGIDGSLSDSSVTSEDSDKVVLAMLRQAGGARQGREEESGLLLVSVSYPTIRSSGKDKTPDGHASLLGATLSLRCKLDHNLPTPTDDHLDFNPSRGEGPPSSLRTEPAKFLGNVKVKDVLGNNNTCSNSDEKSTSGCSSDGFRLFGGTGADKCSTEVCMEACVRSGSDGCASAHDSRGGEYGAVLGVKRRELRGHPVLYLRVRVKAPPRSRATYHGVTNLVPCFSSLGLEIQEKRDLVKEQVGSRGVHRRASSASGPSALSAGGRSPSREEGRKGRAREATTFCTVSVTTTYVPHTSGVLEVNPSELRLTPPSTEDINRWCAYTDLREATEPRASVARAPRAAQDGGLACATRCVFLRVRVLPSGPWAFTRTFQANWPRPMEWARDSSNAGLTRIPAWAPVALEVDTFIHAKRGTSTSSTGAADASSDGELEALMLEICLFDNLPSVPSSLLGRGTLPLTPSIAAGCHHNRHGQRTATFSQAPNRDVSDVQADKEVALVDPVSGMKVASVTLCVLFLHGGGATSGAAAYLRNLADADGGVLGRGARPPYEVSAVDVSASSAVWSLKSKFYHLDHRNTGAVWLDALLDSIPTSEWPWGESREFYADGSMGPKEGQVNGRGALLDRSKSLGPRERCRFSDHSSTGVNVDDGKRWIRRFLEPLVSKDDGVVPWEVWAALCEALCHPRESARITPASVWKRAAELQSATLCSSNCYSEEHESQIERRATERKSRTGRDSGAHAFQGQSICGYNTNERNAGSDEVPNGYDVVTFVADEGPLQDPVRNEALVGGNVFRATSPPTRPTGTRRRLHRTLATSQRVWSREHQPQAHLGPTNGVKRSVSPKQCSIVVSPLRGSNRASRPGTNEPNLRPATESPRCHSNTNAAPSCPPARPASAEHRPPTTAGAVAMGLDPSSSGREPPTWIGAWGIAAGRAPTRVGAWGVAAEAGVVGTERDMTAREVVMRRLELDNRLKETSSAKRKASRYKACMLEAQSFLDEERRRIILLEERALGFERQLLQRDRVRIHEAARARTRFLELEMNRTRRSDRLIAKRAREHAEVVAATVLQLRAKGFVQRTRYKAQLVSIVALQRMVRLRREARSRRRHRARRLSAALLLQSLWRGRLTRKLLAARATLTTKAQALVRGGLQRARIRDALHAHLRRRREAAVLMQKNRRQVVARQAFLALRVASVKLQMCYRRRRATKTIQRAARLYLFNSGRQKAANLLQTSYRLSTRTKKARRERRKIVAAAGALQRVARGWAARRAVREVLEAQRRNGAAAIVQRSLGRYLAAQKIRRRRFAAALTICGAVGIFSVKLSRLRLKRDAVAATTVQSVYRGYRSRVTTGARLAELNGAATKVQTLFRCRHQEERVSFIMRRAQRRNEATKNEKTLPQTKPTHQHQPLTTTFTDVVTPAVRSEGLGHAASSAKFEGKMTQVGLSSVCGHATGGKRDGGVEHGLPLTSLTKSKLRVAELRQAALEVDKNSPPPAATGGDRAVRRRCREREALQSAVQAVARGMVRHGAITPDDARGLAQTLSLGEDDPALEAALRRQLSGLQSATDRSKPRDSISSEHQGLGVRSGYKVIDAATELLGVGGGDERALRRVLSVLERSLERRLPLPLQ